jgi:anti-anti-sigma factor
MTSEFGVGKHDEGDGVARLVLHGEIDADVSEAVTTIITNAARQDGVTALVIDLDDVPLLAAAGLRALIEGHATAVQHGLPYRVVNARGIALGVIEAAGLLDLLKVGVLPRHEARVALS